MPAPDSAKPNNAIKIGIKSRLVVVTMINIQLLNANRILNWSLVHNASQRLELSQTLSSQRFHDQYECAQCVASNTKMTKRGRLGSAAFRYMVATAKSAAGFTCYIWSVSFWA